MAFTAKDWKDYPDTTTPITAAALEDLETRVVAAGLNATTASGKKIAWGSSSTSGFGGANRLSHTIAHGLGSAPVAVFAWALYLASGSTSTVADEPVVCSLDEANTNSTNIVVKLAIANGATASVGTKVFWVAIY